MRTSIAARNVVWTVLPAVFVFACAWAFAALQEKDSGSVSSFKVDRSPVRGEFQPLRLRRTGFTYKCSECHRSFETPDRYTTRVAEHADLVLDHGRNDYCLNCHHKTNRDVYVAHDGSEIPATSPALLCAKCHGPVYRDWLNGAHGRRSGAWSEEFGGRAQLLCIQCHDPHSPKFGSLAPMPGPEPGRQSAAGESH